MLSSLSRQLVALSMASIVTNSQVYEDQVTLKVSFNIGNLLYNIIYKYVGLKERKVIYK